MLHWLLLRVPIPEHLALSLNGVFGLVRLCEASVFEFKHVDVFPQLDDLSSLCLQVVTFVLDVFHGSVEHLLL